MPKDPVRRYNKLITNFVPASINRRTGKPHTHARQIARNLSR